MELEDRPAEVLARRRGSYGFRNHQHVNRLVGFERKTLQNELAMLADRSLSPVCFHALSTEDLVVSREAVARPAVAGRGLRC